MTSWARRRYAAPEYVLMRELEGEAVILDLKGEMYFGLNEVGTRMWSLLAASDPVQDVLETLLDEYDVPPDELRRDLSALIEELVARGLLEPVPR